MKLHKILTACLLVVTVISLCLFAVPTKAEADSYNGFTYSVSNGEAKITEYTGSATDLTIPSTLRGNPVTAIGNAAFSGCSSLTSVTIPDRVTDIGAWAFSDCSSLTSVTIPDSVTDIGAWAFSDCSSLAGIWVDANNPNYSSDDQGVLFNKSKTTLIQALSGITSSYTIPNSVTSLGDYAFSGCCSLTEVTIPDNVTSIGACAFSSCDSLANVIIGKGVTNIGYAAFSNCPSLTNMTIPTNVTTIGESVFHNCSSLTGIWVDENNTEYSNDSKGVLFNKDKTELMQAPGALSGGYAIPDGVINIADNAFDCCEKLTTVVIPDSVTVLGNDAFRDCRGLTEVVIGNGVTEIGLNTFYYCDSLTSLTIPLSVIEIGYMAFEYCSSLQTIYYAGGASQWNSISISSYNSGLASATVKYLHVHDYTLLPAVKVDPDCAQDGYTEYTCVYGDAYRITTPALGHKHGEKGVVVAPTCTEPGYTKYTCARCDDNFAADYVLELGHDYTGPTVTVEPTCTERGYTGTICTRCNSVDKTNYTDVVAHKLVLVPAVAPTCEKTGLSVGTACQWCGMVGVVQKEVAALGGSCDYTADPTTCGTCGNVRVSLQITKVTLRPSAAGIYFKGNFTFAEGLAVKRYGIAVSLENVLPVADDSDPSSLYTADTHSVLISNILDGDADDVKNGRKLIYARTYVLLEDGTYIYGDVVAVNLLQVLTAVDNRWDSLTNAQKNAITQMYNCFISAMQIWTLPNIKKYAQAA